MSNQKQEREPAKGSLRKVKVGELWTGKIMIAGMNDVRTKDGGSFTSWWCLLKLTTPFSGVAEDRETVTDFEINDTVFANITGKIAIANLSHLLDLHGNMYKSGRWFIPEEKEILITYSKIESKKSGRPYYNLTYTVS